MSLEVSRNLGSMHSWLCSVYGIHIVLLEWTFRASGKEIEDVQQVLQMYVFGEAQEAGE